MTTEQEIEIIFKRNYATLVNRARFYTSEYAEDIVIGVFERFISKYRQGFFESVNNIDAYLFRAVTNACLDYCRKKVYEGKFSKDLEKLHEDPGQANELYTEETYEIVLKEIEELPLGRRVIMKMFYIEGLSTKEIAARLHVTCKTILNQKLRAIETLYTKLISGAALSQIG